MGSKLVVRVFAKIFICVVTMLASSPFCSAATGKILKRLNGGDGADPTAGLILDSAGNLYGTAYSGGNRKCGNNVGCGTVFEIARTADGWETKTVHVFCSTPPCGDGALPAGELIFDTLGNLYGTATQGGAYNSGVVFEMSPNADGSWTENVLYSFTGASDGNAPIGGVVFDSNGDLYGAAKGGGGSGRGVVFELSPSEGGPWQETVLYSFTGLSDGGNPAGGVIFDPAGNLYGAAGESSNGTGIVFELSKGADGAWHENVLASAQQASGSVALDGQGNVYGTDYEVPGNENGDVFELSPLNGTWTKTILYSFTGGTDGGQPLAGVTLSKAGRVYGTASYGGGGACRGSIGCGVAFELSRTAEGWEEIPFASPNVRDGFLPQAGLIMDLAGHLYGTTSEGGLPNNCGVVFEIIP